MGRKKNRANAYAVITGASSGIGECFAKRFAREGYSLVLVARRVERLQQLAGELRKLMGSAQDILIISADLEKSEEVERLFREIGDRHVLFFINNAGFGDCGYFLDTDEKKELSMIDVNIKAVHLATKLALRRMSVKDRGYILNVASSAGLLPAGPYMATYYATKAYVTSMTRAVAEELRENGSRIYVGALCPGPVDTEFNHVANVEFALKGITAEYCANYAVDQMKRRRTIIVPTVAIWSAVTFGRLLPTPLVVRITARQQKKKLS